MSQNFRPWIKAKLPVFFFAYFILQTANAQIYNGSVSSATGGTGRAAVEAGDANYLNPATIVHLKGRHFYSSFAQTETALGLTDNSEESSVPASFAYLRKRVVTELSQNVDIQDMRLSLADFAYQQFAVGITGHLYQINDGENHAQQINGDVGFSYTPAPQYGLGLVFYDVAGESKNLPAAYRLSPKIGFGFNYIYRSFLRLRADLVSAPNQNFNKPTYEIGYESYFNKWWVVRLGYQADKYSARDLMTAGLGLDLPRFTLNYGYQGDTKDSSHRHSVDLGVPF